MDIGRGQDGAARSVGWGMRCQDRQPRGQRLAGTAAEPRQGAVAAARAVAPPRGLGTGRRLALGRRRWPAASGVGGGGRLRRVACGPRVWNRRRASGARGLGWRTCWRPVAWPSGWGHWVVQTKPPGPPVRTPDGPPWEAWRPTVRPTVQGARRHATLPCKQPCFPTRPDTQAKHPLLRSCPPCPGTRASHTALHWRSKLSEYYEGYEGVTCHALAECIGGGGGPRGP